MSATPQGQLAALPPAPAGVSLLWNAAFPSPGDGAGMIGLNSLSGPTGFHRALKTLVKNQWDLYYGVSHTPRAGVGSCPGGGFLCYPAHFSSQSPPELLGELQHSRTASRSSENLRRSTRPSSAKVEENIAIYVKDSHPKWIRS